MYYLTYNQNQPEKKITREEWLTAAKEELRPLFLIAGYDLPEKIRMSVGFSGKNIRGSRNGKILGVAYNHIVSSDDTCEIFVTPEIDNAVDVLAILCHELIHAILPNAGHGAAFRQCAVAIGLEGRMTSTIASLNLREKLEAIVNKIGKYPMAKLNLTDREKQSTRLHKIECPLCGAVAYMTRKWLDKVGTPACGCGSPLPMNEM